jgi:desulfoferrodoxin (superoxide reductase-like protein)
MAPEPNVDLTQDNETPRVNVERQSESEVRITVTRGHVTHVFEVATSPLVAVGPPDD